jgi:hypothetical protein
MKMVSINGLVFQWIRLPKQPIVSGKVTQTQIMNRTEFKNADIKTSDTAYDLIELSKMIEIIQLNRFNELKYVSEKRDCDDYSFGLMGLIRQLLPGVCFGIAWASVYDGKKLAYKHALNWFIDDKKNLYLVEPQTNKSFTLPAHWKIDFVVI